MTGVHDLATGLLRRLDAEEAHRLALAALRLGLGPRLASGGQPALAQTLWGLEFPNPIGLAAGCDKDATVTAPMLRAGFGFVEAGTVTPRPQPGNPRPRLFRLEADGAVINRLGFNNGGLDAFAAKLAARDRRLGLVGANIGRNKDSADAIADYVAGLVRLAPLADYLVVNVSSPNTPGLRDLQAKGALDALLAGLAEARALAPRRPPLLLKIAPDLADGDLEDIVEVAVARGLDGLVVSNTTISRPPGLTGPRATEAGGLSGRPLLALSTRMLARARKLAGDRLVLIGVGGVASGEDAYAKIRAGASLVQLYTALVYHGPGLVADIRAGLAAALARDGFAHVGDAVGVDAARIAG